MGQQQTVVCVPRWQCQIKEHANVQGTKYVRNWDANNRVLNISKRVCKVEIFYVMYTFIYDEWSNITGRYTYVFPYKLLITFYQVCRDASGLPLTIDMQNTTKLQKNRFGLRIWGLFRVQRKNPFQLNRGHVGFMLTHHVELTHTLAVHNRLAHQQTFHPCYCDIASEKVSDLGFMSIAFKLYHVVSAK